jgi:hypothetical protein
MTEKERLAEIRKIQLEMLRKDLLYRGTRHDLAVALDLATK